MLFSCVFFTGGVLLHAPRVFTVTTHCNTNEEIPQMGTACPHFWLVPKKSDKLRQNLKCTCFVIKPRAELGRFIILFECKIMPNCVFFASGGPSGSASSGLHSAGGGALRQPTSRLNSSQLKAVLLSLFCWHRHK